MIFIGIVGYVVVRVNSDFIVSLSFAFRFAAVVAVFSFVTVAEGASFELSEDFHPRWFSRPVHSTTLPPLLTDQEFTRYSWHFN